MKVRVWPVGPAGEQASSLFDRDGPPDVVRGEGRLDVVLLVRDAVFEAGGASEVVDGV